MTGNQTTNLTLRIDKEIKAEAEELFAELGMSLFYRGKCLLPSVCARGRIPFRHHRVQTK